MLKHVETAVGAQNISLHCTKQQLLGHRHSLVQIWLALHGQLLSALHVA
jgi:hypothetical protein